MEYTSRNQLKKSANFISNRLQELADKADTLNIDSEDLDNIESEYNSLVSAIADNFKANVISRITADFDRSHIEYTMMNDTEDIYINILSSRKTKTAISILYRYKQYISVELDNGLYISPNHI